MLPWGEEEVVVAAAAPPMAKAASDGRPRWKSAARTAARALAAAAGGAHRRCCRAGRGRQQHQRRQQLRCDSISNRRGGRRGLKPVRCKITCCRRLLARTRLDVVTLLLWHQASSREGRRIQQYAKTTISHAPVGSQPARKI